MQNLPHLDDVKSELVFVTPKVGMLSELVKKYINKLKALFYTCIIRFSSAGHSLATIIRM